MVQSHGNLGLPWSAGGYIFIRVVRYWKRVPRPFLFISVSHWEDAVWGTGFPVNEEIPKSAV